jgi:acyl transferase domain-containing protein
MDTDLNFRALQNKSFRDPKFCGNSLQDIKEFDHSAFSLNHEAAAMTDPQQPILSKLSYEALGPSGYVTLRYPQCRKCGQVFHREEYEL